MAEAPAKTLKKTSYHHGDLRTHLVEATRQLVEEKGPSGFSVAEAARLASVSTAAPYRHFKDRTALLHVVAEEGMHRLTASFDARVADLPPGSAEAIIALGCAYVDFAQAEPNVFRLMFAASAEKPESLTEAGMTCFGRLLRQVALYLSAEETSEETMSLAMPLWMMVHGASFLQIDGKLDGPFSEGICKGHHANIDQATRRLLGEPLLGVPGDRAG